LLLGRLFGRDLLGSDFLNSIDWIVPVPLASQREKERGYNQAEMIARGLSEATSLPVLTGKPGTGYLQPDPDEKDKNAAVGEREGHF